VQLLQASLPTQLARVIPEELRNLPKFEVTFFMDRIPLALKSGTNNQNAYNLFLKLLDLYTNGVLSQHEFMTMAEDLKVSDSGVNCAVDETFL